MTRCNRLARAALAVAAAVASAPNAFATNYAWANGTGGNWYSTANWSPTGIPASSSSTALFNLGPSNPTAFAAYPGYAVDLPLDMPADLLSFQSFVVQTDRVSFTSHRVSSDYIGFATTPGAHAVATFTNSGASGGTSFTPFGQSSFGDGGGTAVVSFVNSRAGSFLNYVGRGAGSDGSVTLSAGSKFNFTNLSVGVDGGSGSLTADGTGTLLQQTGTTSPPPSIIIGDAVGAAGTLALTNGATANITTASLYVGPGGTLSISGGSQLYRSSGVATATIAGRLSITGGYFDYGRGTTVVTPTGIVELNGGSVYNLRVQGTLTGRGSITDELILDPTAAVNLLINSAADYDRIGSSGSFEFGGTLNVAASPSYSPQIGDTFRLITYSIAYHPTTQFATVNLPPLPSSLWWDTSALYSGGRITVVPEPTPLLGTCGVALALLARRRTASE